MTFSHSLLSILLLSIVPSALAAVDAKPALRVIRDHCVGCHKPGKAKGGLLLTTYEKMMKGGDNGAPVVPGKAGESLLYKSVLADGDPHMPPKKQLPAADVAALKVWIDGGAAWDAAVFDEPPAPKKVKLAAMPASYRPVLALALAPDEKRIAFARGNAVVVCDLAKPDRPVLGKLEGHTEPVQSVAWSADGKWIISGGWQRIVVWDAATMKEVRALPGSLVGNITALVIDPTSKILFATDGESGGAGFIRKFDLAQDKLIATWKAHEDTVYSLRLSAKGDRLLSGGADKLAKLWDTTTLKLISIFEGHTNHVLSVAFNHDATQIATAGADKEVKVWEVSSGNQEVKLGDKKTVYTAIAWSPDGKSLAAITEKGTGAVYTELQKHSGTERSETGKERKLGSVDDMLTSVVITADAKTVYAGGFNGKVHVWDASSGKATGEIVAK
jgi:WD40 repeat protein